ncbi:murein DD-endopeptidase MepM [Salinivibrio proteolyticus]|uniref:Murein DD-endopeptidase MepM n=1 Tax=Salinivibrio proteolyticus TaxID=334715 RepID=A0ABY7LEK4_9GAMM|nr:murein DD-endopeptidase MepM [Salinivibrio proteolyticus]WBA15663.1 murein DD-endopeptidase MepM [Salinivibrio proteolyticus]
MKLLTNWLAATARLPRQHKLALASLSLLVAAALMWQPHPFTHHDERRSLPLIDEQQASMPLENSEPIEVGLDADDPALTVPEDALEQDITSEAARIHTHTVASGDTLGAIFSQYGLPLRQMYQILDVNQKAGDIRLGQKIDWQIDDEGQLSSLTVYQSIKYRDQYVFGADGVSYEQLETTGVYEQVTLSGRVTSSFYQQARQAGLTPNQIQNLVSALQWRFDFGAESHRGDRFSVLVNKEFIDNKAVSSGEVMAMLYQAGDRDIFVYRHTDGRFYDEQGHSLDRALRRFPTAKRYRISSSFDPHRKHPITGRISPHNGTDFATPVGTPVLAAGDGVVVKARKHPLAGNYVVIKHGREYSTRYLHLHRILVKPGDHVSMGQKIALSGNTGRSTGPHLHFELIKYGHPVNAMKVPLPEAHPVPRSEQDDFKRQARRAHQQLSQVLNS